MKKWLLTFVVALLLLPSMAVTTSADELQGLSLEKEVREAIALGIIQGDTKGNINPKHEVTREQFAAFIARMLKLEPSTSQVPFIDYTNGHRLSREVMAVVDAGYIQGTRTNEFLPNDPITREQIATIIANILTEKNLTESKRIKLLDSEAFGGSTTIRNVYQVYAYGISSGTWMNEAKTEMRYSPKNTAKRDEAAATLLRLNKVLIEQPTVKPPVLPEPTPEPKPDPKPPVVAPKEAYTLAYVKNGKLVQGDKSFKNYANALSEMTKDPNAVGVYNNNKVVAAKNGIAYGPTAGKVVTVYKNSNLTEQYTYQEPGKEMKIISNGEKAIYVKIGDTLGYVNASHVNVLPYESIQYRDYYKVATNGMLVHYPKNHLNTTANTYGYVVGPASPTMKSGDKFYSLDGVHFEKIGTRQTFVHYPYFQFQSIRTKTNYTAEELDAFISSEVQRLEATGIARYAEASKKSKLIGLGSYLKEVEEKHRVNALFILGAAIHESDFGTSWNALNKNNIFGIRVFDSNPGAGEMYATPERSIDAFIAHYMNDRYAIPSARLLYSNGAVPGNKTIGANVMYASDPHWGAKIASKMWTADQFLGQKDYKQHRLAITTNKEGATIYREPSTTSGPLFKYQAKYLGHSGYSGYPLAIVDEQRDSQNRTWYKVFSDELIRENGAHVEFGWVQAKDVKLISE
ncbi:S-layer homology domain-containing protein [Savagea sp. SN6]|uniref:S-layer homology domain-containing protein n=1 Tax=Savagea serpentis TaxID=2785297 RepID=A0A8J7KLK7_9BACL|nr:S-layer homology domain-containing protein [Savagea serpentis]MBF4501409.1 S-layer homology domain-containing protein [Savagea serpentis]